jgi:hypothetical protein
LPLGAVKNALQRDGLDPKIMDLDPEKSLASQQNEEVDLVDKGPPLKDDPTYQKYFKVCNNFVMLVLCPHVASLNICVWNSLSIH